MGSPLKGGDVNGQLSIPTALIWVMLFGGGAGVGQLSGKALDHAQLSSCINNASDARDIAKQMLDIAVDHSGELQEQREETDRLRASMYDIASNLRQADVEQKVEQRDIDQRQERRIDRIERDLEKIQPD